MPKLPLHVFFFILRRQFKKKSEFGWAYNPVFSPNWYSNSIHIHINSSQFNSNSLLVLVILLAIVFIGPGSGFSGKHLSMPLPTGSILHFPWEGNILPKLYYRCWNNLAYAKPPNKHKATDKKVQCQTERDRMVPVTKLSPSLKKIKSSVRFFW